MKLPQSRKNSWTKQTRKQNPGLLPLQPRCSSPNLKSLKRFERELTETHLKSEEYLDGWQRSRAEFTNYKKQIDREQSQTYQQAAGTVIKQFLGIMDDLERALKTRPIDGEGAAWSNGIELVYRKLVAILENEGLKTIQAEGQMFDPKYP